MSIYKMDMTSSAGIYTKNGKFSVDFMYNALIKPDVPIEKNHNNKLWKLKISLLIKASGWYLWKGVILTKDNLTKLSW
jgi:hypothetical protein